MREKTELFTINGEPLLVPDEKVSISYEDLAASDSGRDESGVMHRIVTRYGVTTWKFTYSHLTEEEKRYIESLFVEMPTFTFGHPSRSDASLMETSECYRSKCGISWKNAKTGLWSGYSFTVTQC